MRGVIKTLTERARRICEPDELQGELKHLERAFGWNGYSKKDFNRAIRPKNSEDCSETTETQDEHKSWACLPYIHGVTDTIGKILEKHQVKTIFKPTRTIQQTLRSAKDKRDPLSAPGVYKVPCSCGRASAPQNEALTLGSRSTNEVADWDKRKNQQ
ncbi:hypothetical protein D910_00155 [Dendroctonus ponderosae]|uniref:Helix-turn-helix domain-containing protein n=1 Tax=Dendroctonus ponderosae TaxID=77166 RepID=U4URI3_DENPD|nr:hypothetical protein D910_00155 [Dendroctonus ponderosae]